MNQARALPIRIIDGEESACLIQGKIARPAPPVPVLAEHAG